MWVQSTELRQFSLAARCLYLLSHSSQSCHFSFLKTESLCSPLAVLELAMQARLASSSQNCLCLYMSGSSQVESEVTGKKRASQPVTRHSGRATDVHPTLEFNDYPSPWEHNDSSPEKRDSVSRMTSPGHTYVSELSGRNHVMWTTWWEPRDRCVTSTEDTGEEKLLGLGSYVSEVSSIKLTNNVQDFLEEMKANLHKIQRVDTVKI